MLFLRCDFSHWFSHCISSCTINKSLKKPVRKGVLRLERVLKAGGRVLLSGQGQAPLLKTESVFLTFLEVCNPVLFQLEIPTGKT